MIDMNEYILKTRAAELILGHFPVRKVTSLGLLGEYCLCGVRFVGNVTFPRHVIDLLEGDTNAKAQDVVDD